jgi:peptide chain release factor 2
LEKQTNDPNLWDSPERAQTLLKKLSNEKEVVHEWKDFNKELDDLILLLELSEEEDSTDTLKELEKESKHLLDQVKSLELRGLMSALEDADADVSSLGRQSTF